MAVALPSPLLAPVMRNDRFLAYSSCSHGGIVVSDSNAHLLDVEQELLRPMRGLAAHLNVSRIEALLSALVTTATKVSHSSASEQQATPQRSHGR